MITFTVALLVATKAFAGFYPSVTFIPEVGGPEKQEALQALVTEADQGKCSVFFEFLPRRFNADAAAKIKFMKTACTSKKKFDYVFGIDSEALKMLEVVASLYIGLRQEYRDVGAQTALSYAIGELTFRRVLKKDSLLQPWRDLIDLGLPKTVFERLTEMPPDELRTFLKALYQALQKHVALDDAKFLPVDLDGLPQPKIPSAAIDAYLAEAEPLRHAYMAESIVKCEKALTRPVKVVLMPDHVDKMIAEFRKVWSGLEINVIKTK